MDYEKICDKILNCDNQIRYVGIYDYGELYDKMKSGISSYLTKEETEISLSHAVYRWSTRKKTVGGAGLILISAELTANVNEIVDKVLVIQSKYS